MATNATPADGPEGRSGPTESTPATSARGLRRLLAWRRLRFMCIAAVPFGLLLSISSSTSAGMWVLRSLALGVVLLLAYGLLETWPERLPRPLARWVLQLLGVVAAVPLGVYLGYWLTTGGDPRLLSDMQRMGGFFKMCFGAVLVAPWLALAAMVRQREALALNQALAFQLERSEFERQALDGRLRLLQSQVQPHFLFNTLANVRALVRSGSPQAIIVLDSLIAYLRAAVPRLDEPLTTLDHELELVRAYLELMQMRMPDRLQFTLQADEGVGRLRCPAMSLLTLVENAVRHGIDPAEEGGRIEVAVMLRAGRCIARVTDTGVGLRPGAGKHGDAEVQGSTGTGLSTLRERLRLAFDGDARLRISALAPRGVCAEVEFPVVPGNHPRARIT